MRSATISFGALVAFLAASGIGAEVRRRAARVLSSEQRARLLDRRSPRTIVLALGVLIGCTIAWYLAVAALPSHARACTVGYLAAMAPLLALGVARGQSRLAESGYPERYRRDNLRASLLSMLATVAALLGITSWVW